jgi:PAS domain S-box-containing protein
VATVELVRPSAEPLESRLEFETLIADTSASLFSASPEQLDHAVEHALERVRVFFHADRCGLLSVDTESQAVHLRLASYGAGVAPIPRDVDLAPLFPYTAQAVLVNRVPFRMSRVSDLPPQADRDRGALAEQGARSALLLPIETGGALRHLIALQHVHEESDWPDVFVTRLRVLGELLAIALERRAMMANLREAEERVTLAAESAEAGLWTLDYRTGVFWVTDKARSMCGYSRDEVVTIERLRASIHPEDRDLVMRAIERSARTGAPSSVEYRIVVPGEERVRWVSSRGGPRLTTDGAPDVFMGVTIDITERRQAEEALLASEARLASGAELAGLGFYEGDYVANVMYVDGRLRNLCGVPAGCDQATQVSAFITDHVHPADRRHFTDLRAKLHDGRLDQLSAEYRYLHPSRGEVWIHHLARVAARDAAGRAIRTVGACRDITAVKRADDELRGLSRRLITAHEEERAQLARELHDDVSQRLAVLAIEVGRADGAAPSGPLAETMREVREELVRLSDDIHALAYHLHPSVLEELGLAEALRTECERRHHLGRIEVALDVQPLPTTFGRDAALCLFRVAQEALNNVVRHARTRAAGVTLREVGGGVLLAVRDEGVGFDPEHPGRGAHLGLASMRERVRLVNGTLDVESAAGSGTTIIAWVPAGGVPA